MKKKRPPENRARCCVGRCNEPTGIIYLQHYPICNKHWSAHCDRKLKYKGFKDLREFLGFPPISKPEGMEDLPEDCFAYNMEICIDVEMNVPVLMDERLSAWQPPVEEVRPRKTLQIQWNGKKEDPLELFVTVNGEDIVVIRATGIAVKFSSEQAIQNAIDKIQSLIHSTHLDSLEFQVKKTFKRSKFWKPNDGFVSLIKQAYDRT